MINKTIRSELVATQYDAQYTIYVFKNLDTNEYYMCTRLPNWETPPIQIGEKGFVHYKIVIAGKDTWYDKINNVHIPYNYDGYHFVNFVREKIITGDIIVGKK